MKTQILAKEVTFIIKSNIFQDTRCELRFLLNICYVRLLGITQQACEITTALVMACPELEDKLYGHPSYYSISY